MKKNKSCKAIYRKSYSNLKTPLKSNITTKSQPTQSSYMEIFILDKHKTQKKQEKNNLERRIKELNSLIEKINKKMDEIKKKIDIRDNEKDNESEDIDMENDVQLNSIRKISIGY